MKAYALALLAVLMGCVSTGLIQRLDAAKNARHTARIGWNQCVADANCQGSEMLKKKAELEFAEMDYASACAARATQAELVEAGPDLPRGGHWNPY